MPTRLKCLKLKKLKQQSHRPNPKLIEITNLLVIKLVCHTVLSSTRYVLSATDLMSLYLDHSASLMRAKTVKN